MFISQVSEAFRSQQLSMQQELSQEQQQQLIQSLLLRQLHMQQARQRRESGVEEAAISPTLAAPQVTLAGLLKEGEERAELRAKGSALQAKNGSPPVKNGSPQTKNGSPPVKNGSPQAVNGSPQNVTQSTLLQHQPVPNPPQTAHQLPAPAAPPPVRLPSQYPARPTEPPSPKPMVTQQARPASQAGLAAIITAVNSTDRKVVHGCAVARDCPDITQPL